MEMLSMLLESVDSVSRNLGSFICRPLCTLQTNAFCIANKIRVRCINSANLLGNPCDSGNHFWPNISSALGFHHLICSTDIRIRNVQKVFSSFSPVLSPSRSRIYNLCTWTAALQTLKAQLIKSVDSGCGIAKLFILLLRH